jgi:hypothetical protein
MNPRNRKAVPSKRFMQFYETRQCVVCGDTFYQKLARGQQYVTCSTGCSEEYRRCRCEMDPAERARKHTDASRKFREAHPHYYRDYQRRKREGGQQ